MSTKTKRRVIIAWEEVSTFLRQQTGKIRTKRHEMGRGADEIINITNLKNLINFKQQSCTPSHYTKPKQMRQYTFAANVTGMIADIGATGNYISIDTPHTKRKKAPTLAVNILDGLMDQLSHTCNLLLPYLSPEARRAHIFLVFPLGALL